MNKKEFLEQLRLALLGEVDTLKIEENISYYHAYIQSEIEGGKLEEEVLMELGNPRLIAKSIIQSQDMNSYKAEQVDNTNEQKVKIKFSRIKVWLYILLFLAIIIFIIGIFFSLVWTLLPILLPMLLVIYCIKVFSK